MIFMADFYNEIPDTIITGTALADTITNSGANVTISSGKGDDEITNSGVGSSIDAGKGDDYI